MASGDPAADSLNRALPAQFLRLSRTAHSSEIGGYLVEILAQIADLTQDGTSPESAIERILGATPANDWLKRCLLSNWHDAKANRVITPKNLDRMRAGEMPVLLGGIYEGKELAVLMQRDPKSPARPDNVTYRLVPEPVLEERLEQMTDAIEKTPGPNGQGLPRDIPDGAIQDWMNPSTPYSPRPTIGSTLPNWPSSPGKPSPPASRVPGSSFNQPIGPYLSTPIKVDVKLGGTPEIEKIIGSRAHVYVNSVDEAKGIRFSVVDGDIDPAAKLLDAHADTKYYRTKRVVEPIPGSNEKGTFLISIGKIRYYLDSTDPGNGRYRLVIFTFPAPAGSDPPTEPELDPDHGD